MEICLHSCDVSNPSREFSVCSKWTYLLFEEFFNQGDLEQEKGLPVSMLCDRTTTHVAKSQPGFIQFVSLPLFTTLSAIMPELNKEIQSMKANSDTWKSYEETEEDKRVYERKNIKVVQIEVEEAKTDMLNDSSEEE